MNFSVLNAERRPDCGVLFLSGLIREPVVRQIMRISVVFLMLLFSTLQFLLATPSRGQGVDDTRLTLELKGENLASALRKIEKVTSFRFVYRNEEIRAVSNLKLAKAERTLSETLSLLLADTRFTYREMKNNILIVHRDEPEASHTTEVPDHTVRGKVVDENGEPLAGVSILLKGSATGTTTDADGNYSLTVPDGNQILVFSFIGFASQEVSIQNRTTVDVILLGDITSLDEIVVTALGITRDERSLGYATQQIKGENLTFTNDQNVIGSLAGKIAGVQVIGAPGASMGGTQKIKIRGVNSLTAGDEPLIVVDGTPISNSNFSGSVSGYDFGNLSQDINMDDVESINVLKGPAASALYGIRGQYGVIMIETKKGRKGAENFNVDVGLGYMIDNVTNLPPQQNLYGGGTSQTWLTLPNGDPYVNMADESWGPRMDGRLVRDFFSFYPQDPQYGELTPYVPQPNNIRDYFQTGTNFNKSVSVYGGGQKSNYRISFNNSDISGIEPNTFLKRNNIGASLGLDLTEKINVSANLNYANNSGRRPEMGVEAGTRYMFQWFARNVDMKRLENYRYPDGQVLHWNVRQPSASTGEVTNFRPRYFDNPFFIAHEKNVYDQRDRMFGNVGLNYEVVDGLTLSGNLRTDRFTQQIETKRGAGGYSLQYYGSGKYQNEENNYELMARYEKEFNDFSIDATVGTNRFEREYSYISFGTVGGLIVPDYYNAGGTVDRPSLSSYLMNKVLLSSYGLVSLGYRDTYFVDVTMRNDKSSALPVNNNSYWYPSVSSSFVFSELLNSSVLELGKLRLSYARAGSDLSAYMTTPVYSLGSVYGTTNTLAVPDALSNPNVKPAFATSYEAGLDLNLWGKLNFSFTYYQNVNENQILNLAVSGTSGYSNATINAGQIRNKGIELSISGSPVQTRDLTWNASFNVARNKNMLVELYPGIDVDTYDWWRYSSLNVYLNNYTGRPYGTLEGRAYQRDEATGLILLDQNNLPMPTDEVEELGSILPDFTGGLLNTVTYKNFQLSAMIDFQAGGAFYSRTLSLSDRTGLSERSAAMNDQGKNVRDPLNEGGGVKVHGISTESGDEVTAYVSAQAYYGRVGQQIDEEYVYDATYVKLRELRLGYNFGKGVLGKLPVQKVGVAIIARNLWQIHQAAPKGIDPSELSAGYQGVSWYESGQLNSVRSIGLDLNITF